MFEVMAHIDATQIYVVSSSNNDINNTVKVKFTLHVFASFASAKKRLKGSLKLREGLDRSSVLRSHKGGQTYQPLKA